MSTQVFGLNSQLLAISMPGGTEWIFIMIIVLILFGARKLPELARGLGSSIKEFKKAKEEIDLEFQKSVEDVKIEQPKGRQAHAPAAPTAPQPTTATAPKDVA
jgi:sec-independent protein translocase protein TatA